MTAILVAAAALVAVAAGGAAWVLGRAAYRAYVSRRLLKQGNEVRARLAALRELDGGNVDKMMFEMRDLYNVRVLEEELRVMLSTTGGYTTHGADSPYARACNLLGLTDRYLDRVRTGFGWRERADCASALGWLGDPRAVGPLLAAMRDPKEDDDVKLACAEALGRLRDSSVIPVMCEELNSVDEWASPRLAQILVAFGGAAVEPLLAALDSPDNVNASVWAGQILGKIGDRRAVAPLIDRLHDRSERVRMSAASALGDIRDSRAVKPLINLILRDPVAPVRAQSAAALGRIGDSEALPLLVQSLGDPEYWMRFRALEAIEALEVHDPSPIEAALADSNAEVRRRAALALERLGFLEHHFDALGSTDDARAEAARAMLIVVGRAGLSERLVRYLEDERAVVRARIASVLGPVGAPQHATALVGVLSDASEEVRLCAVQALGELAVRGTATSLIPALLEPSHAIRAAAVEALTHYNASELGHLGPPVIALLDHETDTVRTAAAQALATIPGEQVDSALIGALEQRHVEVRFAAIKAIAARRIPSAVEALARCLDDSSAKTRLAAAEALGAIGGTSAIDHLISAMHRADVAQRDSICATLAGLGFDAIHPALDILLAREDIESRLGAVWTLGKTGDERAAALLAAMLREPEERIRSSAAGALGKIRSARAASALAGALADPAPRVRSATTNALGRIGGPEYVPALIAMLADPSAFVRNRAALAVARTASGSNAAHRAAEAIGGAPHLEPPFRLIGLALVGTPGAVADAVAGLRDAAQRQKVQAQLESEDPFIRQQFFANLELRSQQPASTQRLERIDPEALLGNYAVMLRNSADPDARLNAITALAKLDEPRAIEALGEAVRHDPDERVRLAGARALIDHRDLPVAREVLMIAARDPAPAVRVVALQQIAHFVPAGEAEILFESLRSRAAEVRHAAEEALAAVYAGPLEQLHDWLMGRDNDAQIEAGLRVLRRIADARSSPLMRQLLRSRAPGVRIEAARALAALNVPEAVFALLDAMSDPLEGVRVAVVESLAGTTRADVVERLSRAALDPSVRVRLALAGTLSRLESSRAVDVLAKLAQDVAPEVAAAAVCGLVTVADPEGQRRMLELWSELAERTRTTVAQRADASIDALTEQATTAFEPERRAVALQVLAALDLERHAPRVARALVDPDPQVRLTAIDQLARLDPAAAQEWLRGVLDDPVPAVRTAAHRALVRPV